MIVISTHTALKTTKLGASTVVQPCTCSASILYGHWFMSYLLHFLSSSLLRIRERRVTQRLEIKKSLRMTKTVISRCWSFPKACLFPTLHSNKTSPCLFCVCVCFIISLLNVFYFFKWIFRGAFPLNKFNSTWNDFHIFKDDVPQTTVNFMQFYLSDSSVFFTHLNTP